MRYGRDVSTRQIAEAAGIAEGTIFRVFPNKDAVIDAVIEDAFEAGPTLIALTDIDPRLDLTARLELAVEILEARMRRVISLFGAFRHSPQQPSSDGRHESHESHASHEQRRRADNARLTEALVEVIGDDADQFRVPATQAAELIRGLVFTVTHPALGVTFSSEPRVLVDTLLNGIRRPPDSEIRPC